MLSVKKLPDCHNKYGAFDEHGTLLFCLEQKGTECEVREITDEKHCRGRLLVTFIGVNCLEEASRWASTTGILLLRPSFRPAQR